MSEDHTLSCDELAEMLEQIAEYQYATDDTPFRAQSYEKAAEIVSSESTEEIRDDPQQFSGIGESLGDKISEYWETGKIEYLDQIHDEIGFDLDVLTQVEGLGYTNAIRLNEELGIESLEDLETACRRGKVEKISGFGQKTQENYLEEIGEVRRGTQERKTWGVASSYWEGISSRLQYCEAADRWEPAGSYRRHEDTVGDLDVIVESEDPRSVFDNLSSWGPCDKILSRGDTKMSFRSGPMQVDVLCVPGEKFGSSLLYFTGDKGWNIWMRKVALNQGLSLSEHGIKDNETGEIIEECSTEQEAFDYLDIPFVEPENREDPSVSPDDFDPETHQSGEELF